MHVPGGGCVRSWVARVLDAMAAACFRVGSLILQRSVALETPDQPSPALTRRVLARIASDTQEPYQPTAVDRHAATVAEAYNRSCYVLADHGTQNYVLDDGYGPNFRQVPPS